MHTYQKVFKIVRMKRELKEVYASQVIENLALFLIGIFIPAFILRAGFSLGELVLFMICLWSFYMTTSPLAAKVDSLIGVKHTILLRAPILIMYLLMVMVLESNRSLFFPAAIAGGLSMSIYWTSFNTEYVRTSDRREEGREAGLLIGLPNIAAVIGPLLGAAVLAVAGFSALMGLSVLLVFLSVVPLFMSHDYRSEGLKLRHPDILLDRRKALIYFGQGAIYAVDGVFWGLYVFLSYGFVSLGIAASLMGLGMLLFVLVVGRLSESASARVRLVRVSGVMCAALWVMRFLVESEPQVMVLSLIGGFILTSFGVAIYADFARFAKDNGPARSVVFRQFWLGAGYVLPAVAMLALLSWLPDMEFIRVTFLVAGTASLALLAMKN